MYVSFNWEGSSMAIWMKIDNNNINNETIQLDPLPGPIQSV